MPDSHPTLDSLLSRRQALQAGFGAFAALTAAGLLDGCGSSSSSSSTTTLTNTGQPIKRLSIGLPGSLSNIYPGTEDGILNYYVAALTMEGLLTVSPQGVAAGAIASSWQHPNASTYIYKLRPGVRFSDGSPVTVEDVLYSLKMAANAKVSPGLSSYYGYVKSMEQTGSDEITIRLTAPYSPFQWTPTAAAGLFVAPKRFWQAHNNAIGTSTSLLLGTGPYKVTSFQPDSHVTLVATDSWWGGKPPVEEIEFQFITDDSARYLATKSGSIQMSFNVPLESLSSWNSLPHNRVLTVADRSWAGLVFNMQHGPTADPHVRRAISHCIDRQAVVTELLHGEGQVATAMSPPEQFAGVYTPEQAAAVLNKISLPDFSIDQARAELKASRYPNGFATTLSYPNTGPQLGNAALSMAQNLKEIGINLTVKEIPASQWLNQLGTSTLPLRFMWYFNTTPDPMELAGWLLPSKPAANMAGYSNAEVNALLTKAAAETDPAAHAASVIKAQTVAAAELPYMPLWWGKSLTSFADSVGISPYTSYTFQSPWAKALYSAA